MANPGAEWLKTSKRVQAEMAWADGEEQGLSGAVQAQCPQQAGPTGLALHTRALPTLAPPVRAQQRHE